MDDNRVDTGAIVSGDHRNPAEPFVDTITTIYTSGAEGNGKGKEWEGAHGGIFGRPTNALSCRDMI